MSQQDHDIDSDDFERRAFAIYLRTGLRLIKPDNPAVEVKYNHNHDPRNGRFTYAGSGGEAGSDTPFMHRSGPAPRASIAKIRQVSKKPHSMQPILPTDGKDNIPWPTDIIVNGRRTARPKSTADRVVSGLIHILLPASGVGFRTYNRDGNDQYGTAETIAHIQAIGAKWSEVSNTPMQVGDISRKNGERLKPHESHQKGIDADIRPFRQDKAMLPVRWDSSTYDRATTIKFLQTVKKLHPHAVILFNDPTAITSGLSKHYKGHDDHIHISFRR